jgi:AmmeMemoRadiSam system protein A
VPIEMGMQTEETIQALADALAGVIRDRSDILLVASTDLSHYYPRSQASELDARCISLIESVDGKTMAKEVQSDDVQMCGGGPTAAVLMACRKAGVNGVRVLKYDDSGSAFGDVSKVVGYVSAVLYREGAVDVQKTKTESAQYLDESEQALLIKIARESIVAVLENRRPPAFDVPDGKLTDQGAAFVTLTISGQLRGCIGYTEAFMPLAQCVSDCAISAAVRDPRFRPLTKAEYDKISVEISVLTPLVDVSDVDEIKVGRDGLMITKNGRRGLLLPQVATDNGWDRGTFLINTCRKAGLPDDAWEHDAHIQKFTAFVFGEE